MTAAQVEATPYMDPFAPLADIPELVVPEDTTDAYTFIAYLADGTVIAEFDGTNPGSWSRRVSPTEVMFIDLLPLGYVCPEHAAQPERSCPACVLSVQRRALRPHRLQVPEGGVAHFERRRLVSIDGNQRITWTVLGWERNFLSARPVGLKLEDAGPRNVKVTYYQYFDDLGRTFSSSRLDAI